MSRGQDITPIRGALIGRGALPTSIMQSWIETVSTAANAIRASSTTALRPTKALWVGRPHFDTTLGKPIWYDGSGWVDATGSSV